MSEVINLSEARKNLPELADRVNAGKTYNMSRRGRELAVLIGVDEYRRLKAIEQQQRQKDKEDARSKLAVLNAALLSANVHPVFSPF